jgi:predicted ABC-type ATPase
MDLFVIAGPNGVGKTTFAREFLPKYADCKNFVNADLIAQGMAPFSPETAAIRAGKMMLSEMQSFAKRRLPFAFETTLSGRSYMGLLRRLKAQGYEVHLFSVGRERGSRVVKGPRTSHAWRARCARTGSPSAFRSVHSKLSGSLSSTGGFLDTI